MSASQKGIRNYAGELELQQLGLTITDLAFPFLPVSLFTVSQFTVNQFTVSVFTVSIITVIRYARDFSLPVNSR